MTSLWFLMPAHGRERLARVCMRQLARTIDRLRAAGVDAHAAVVACDGNLNTAAELGFGTVERDNDQLGRRWNDLYQLAYDHGVDLVVPIGSDDWLDANWILGQALPDDSTIRCMRRFAVVDETGGRMAHAHASYDGGVGIRIIPTALLHKTGGRPCVEDRQRAIDTTTLRRLRFLHGNRLQLTYFDLHPAQLVDWKSDGSQLNVFSSLTQYLERDAGDPFAAVSRWYPTDLVNEMRSVYERHGPSPGTTPRREESPNSGCLQTATQRKERDGDHYNVVRERAAVSARYPA